MKKSQSYGKVQTYRHVPLNLPFRCLEPRCLLFGHIMKYLGTGNFKRTTNLNTNDTHIYRSSILSNANNDNEQTYL